MFLCGLLDFYWVFIRLTFVFSIKKADAFGAIIFSMSSDSYLYKGLRRTLVKSLSEKGITDTRVLSCMEKVPRHAFFDSIFASQAYEDKAFPIGEGQTISQPYTVAFQTQLLAPQPMECILEIGTGSGYQACILCCLQADVFSIEYDKVLYTRARALLRKMGYFPHLFHGDGGEGLPRFAPYDGILVTCASVSILPAWKEQLKIGGRIVAPIGEHKRKQAMVKLVKKDAKTFEAAEHSYFSFVPLRGRYQQ